MLQKRWPHAYPRGHLHSPCPHSRRLPPDVHTQQRLRPSLGAGGSETDDLGELCFPALAFTQTCQCVFCLPYAPGQTGINSPKYGPREDVMGKSKDISSRSTSPFAAKMSSWSLAGRCELGAPSRLNQINYPRKIRPTLAPSFHGESVEGMGRCRENVAPVGTIPIPG